MKNLKHVLIVLGCSPTRRCKPSNGMMSRAQKAIQLHKKNNYSAIILSGGSTKRGCPPEAAIMRVMLHSYLPDERLLVETNSKSTVQNALFCWELLKSHNPKSITVVSSKLNIKRTEIIFRKLYAHMGVNLKFESSPNTFDPVEYVIFSIREFLASLYYKIVGIR